MLYVKAEKSPGVTVVFVCVAYAVAESQPLAKAASSGATLHVTLSSRHVARLTWLLPPAIQLDVPVFAKNTENVPVSPGLSVRNALSNWYAESNAAAAAGAGVVLNVKLRANAIAMTAVKIRRIVLPFMKSDDLRSAYVS